MHPPLAGRGVDGSRLHWRAVGQAFHSARRVPRGNPYGKHTVHSCGLRLRHFCQTLWKTCCTFGVYNAENVMDQKRRKRVTKSCNQHYETPPPPQLHDAGAFATCETWQTWGCMIATGKGNPHSAHSAHVSCGDPTTSCGHSGQNDGPNGQRGGQTNDSGLAYHCRPQ